ncbi:hypothetical protein JZ751_000857 [Albula glossodonta]|uniref:Uncharacterized protein n=1 Tax=Albula glossodonta TaxID=121402 RepID=A0A8T2PXG5_9TELE|nr:hypothetical protein JZ751_000857 [Albula glossodonta]
MLLKIAPACPSSTASLHKLLEGGWVRGGGAPIEERRRGWGWVRESDGRRRWHHNPTVSLQRLRCPPGRRWLFQLLHSPIQKTDVEINFCIK